MGLFDRKTKKFNGDGREVKARKPLIRLRPSPKIKPPVIQIGASQDAKNWDNPNYQPNVTQLIDDKIASQGRTGWHLGLSWTRGKK